MSANGRRRQAASSSSRSAAARLTWVDDRLFRPNSAITLAASRVEPPCILGPRHPVFLPAGRNNRFAVEPIRKKHLDGLSKTPSPTKFPDVRLHLQAVT